MLGRTRSLLASAARVTRSSEPALRRGLAIAAGACVAAGTAAECQSWTLTYFPIPGAPGEIVRLMLMLGSDEWVDNRIAGKEWVAFKPTSKFGQLPVLKGGDGREMGQSRAIARYLGKTVGLQGMKPLYPEDPWAAYQVDECIDAIEDIRGKIVKTFAIKDQAQKEAARAALFASDGTGEIFEGLKRIEGLAPAGEHMVWLFCVVNQFRSGFIDGVPANGWMEQLPKLQAVVRAVGEIPQLKAYYAQKVDGEGRKVYEVHAGRR